MLRLAVVERRYIRTSLSVHHRPWCTSRCSRWASISLSARTPRSSPKRKLINWSRQQGPHDELEGRDLLLQKPLCSPRCRGWCLGLPTSSAHFGSTTQGRLHPGRAHTWLCMPQKSSGLVWPCGAWCPFRHRCSIRREEFHHPRSPRNQCGPQLWAWAAFQRTGLWPLLRGPQLYSADKSAITAHGRTAPVSLWFTSSEPMQISFLVIPSKGKNHLILGREFMLESYVPKDLARRETGIFQLGGDPSFTVHYCTKAWL